MTGKTKHTLALFYCQNVPESGVQDRQVLEKAYGPSLRLYPIACSGRLEPLHLLRALEEFADAAYVITCPEGACRYLEGNLRARKRVGLTTNTIAAIGLEEARVGIVINEKENSKSLTVLVGEIMGLIAELKPSPVLSAGGKGKGQEEKKGDKS
ncbi:MAG: hydrogenase iron-sulfur subunit [Desulfobacteraceae bacterium]|jgi:coenzyme F420-reducing hydrogenase delta subunit